MDSSEFREHGKNTIKYVAEYFANIHERRVTPQIQYKYLKELLPDTAPENPEEWKTIMEDVESKIMPGMVHWQHPRFHAYYPSETSYPSILADIIGDTIGCIGFSWASAPSCTELEGTVLDWLAKMMGLPDVFMRSAESGRGGGCIQSSGSECCLMSLMAARADALAKLHRDNPTMDEGVMLSKLIAYCSKEAHPCVEKACMIAFTKLRILETDEFFCVRGDTVRKAMEQDRAQGLYPYFVCCTIGTTSSCSNDNISEIGPICVDYEAWLHVDASYAGCAQICPEFRVPFDGIENAMSLNINANKWLLTNFDCSCYWTRDTNTLTQGLVVDPLYMEHSKNEAAIDYRHWGLPLSRRMRALKLWFVIRIYGVEGLQKHIREHCRLAKLFESLVKGDDRFQIMNKVECGLVCFRMKGQIGNGNGLNQKLLGTVNASGKLFMTPASLGDKYVLRFCVCRETACDADMVYAWDVIKAIADEVEKTETLPEERALGGICA